jgi:precorrin-2/cobalt-factor-2 C20-methyltransferase
LKSGEFYGIGVGPGDVELLTIKAVNSLRKVDVIIAPKTEKKEDSLALSIAQPYLREDTEIVKLVFPMLFDSETLSNAWENNKNIILDLLAAGKKVAFLTLGDPMLYSTYMYIFKLLANCPYRVETIPGIPAFCAIASKLGYPLAEGDDILTIIPATVSEAKLAEVLKVADTAVLMKVYKNYGEVIEQLEQDNFADNAVMISKCGLENEQIARGLQELKAIDGANINYLSTILTTKRHD